MSLCYRDEIRSLCQSFAGHRKPGQIQPPVLCEPVRFPYGPFEFKTRLTKGISYDIEASTNLKNWSQIDNASTEEVDYVDSGARKFSHRFYRLHANGIYSANVIGYAAVALPPGFSMVANPFQAADNSIANLFKGMPEGAKLSKFDAQLSCLSHNALKAGQWTNRTEKLVPGEGAIFFNPTTNYINLNFVGAVMQGNFFTPVPAGFSIRSSVLPQLGSLDADLGFPATVGDVIHLFDRDQQKYVQYPYNPATWSTNPPVVSVGESFWVAKKTANNWMRSFRIESNALPVLERNEARIPINVQPLITTG